jgi:hypothetical protein
VTPDHDHDAADLEAAALELAPGEHVLVFLPPAMWPLGWWRRFWYRVLVPGLWGLFTACEWTEGTLPPGKRVIAKGRGAPVQALAVLVQNRLGRPVALKRAATPVVTGAAGRHTVPCYLVKEAGASGPVTVVVDGRLLARGAVRPAQACLEYSETDPWAVWARFRAGVPGDPMAIDLEWAFARDLLSAGLEVQSGQGAVRVRPWVLPRRSRVVMIELLTPTGTVGFTTPAAGVKRFLEAARALVPPGTEARHVDIDAGIARILADEGSR